MTTLDQARAVSQRLRETTFSSDPRTFVEAGVTIDALVAEVERLTPLATATHIVMAERDQYQRAADDMAMRHKVERDALQADAARLREALKKIAAEELYGNGHAQYRMQKVALAALKGGE